MGSVLRGFLAAHGAGTDGALATIRVCFFRSFNARITYAFLAVASRRMRNRIVGSILRAGDTLARFAVADVGLFRLLRAGIARTRRALAGVLWRSFRARLAHAAWSTIANILAHLAAHLARARFRTDTVSFLPWRSFWPRRHLPRTLEASTRRRTIANFFLSKWHCFGTFFTSAGWRAIADVSFLPSWHRRTHRASTGWRAIANYFLPRWHRLSTFFTFAGWCTVTNVFFWHLPRTHRASTGRRTIARFLCRRQRFGTFFTLAGWRTITYVFFQHLPRTHRTSTARHAITNFFLVRWHRFGAFSTLAGWCTVTNVSLLSWWHLFRARLAITGWRAIAKLFLFRWRLLGAFFALAGWSAVAGFFLLARWHFSGAVFAIAGRAIAKVRFCRTCFEFLGT